MLLSKRIFISTIILLFIFALPIMAYSGGKATSKKTPTPIQIDGNLNDASWLAVSADFVDQEITANPQDWYQIKPKSGADTNAGGLRVSRGQVDSDSDLKGVWMTTWDDDYIYFGFAVSDDVVVEYQGPFDVRTGDTDSLVIIFDTKHDAPVIEFPPKEFDTGAVAAQSTNQADDVFYIMTPITNRGTPAVFEGAALAENPTLNDPANKDAAAVKTSTGYNAEIRIPWSLLEPFYGGPLVPKEGMIMGFDLSLVDSDPTYAAPVGGAMAWSSDFENDNSPGVLGELTLGAELVPSAVTPSGKLASTWGSIKAVK